jgi:hypothetical protein
MEDSGQCTNQVQRLYMYFGSIKQIHQKLKTFLIWTSITPLHESRWIISKRWSIQTLAEENKTTP